MPVMNGLESTKEILKIDINAKIIFISAEKSIEREALSLGAIAFIKKPCTNKTLVNKIKKKIKVMK